MAAETEYRTEHVAMTPSGYHVRTLSPGPGSGHLIRVAFPPGRRKKGSGQLVEILHPLGENPSRCKNPSSVFSMAVSMGYPYLRGESKVAADGRTWLSRVTKHADGSGPALFIGWDGVNRKWVTEKESERNPDRSLEKTGGLHIVYSPVNAAYFLMWHGTVLGIHATKAEAKAEMERLLRKSNPRGRELSVPERHQLKIARDTLKMSDEGALIMGGPTKEQAREIIRRLTGKEPREENPFDWRERREKTGTILDEIRHGDRVTILTPHGSQLTGKAVMLGPFGWVLNLGGRHGTPGIATAENIVKVRKQNPTEQKIEWARVQLLRVRDHLTKRMTENMIKGREVRPSGSVTIQKIEWAQNEIARVLDNISKKDALGLLRQINPDEGQLDAAEDLYKTFHGREPREILEIQESSARRGEYTALGDLVELTFIAPSGDHVLVKFVGDGVRVASSPEGEQLYFLGGNQDVSGSLKTFGVDDAKDLIDLGEVKQIVYEAAKWQTDFTPQEWKHDFGEESGVRPRGFFDQLKKQIFFAGGNYQVKRPGIVD